MICIVRTEGVTNEEVDTDSSGLFRSHERNGCAWYMLLDEQRSTPQQIAVKPMVADIQSTRLQLHPYTVRQETLPKYVQNIDGLYSVLFQHAKADGIFTDFPDTLVQYLKR